MYRGNSHDLSCSVCKNKLWAEHLPSRISSRPEKAQPKISELISTICQIMRTNPHMSLLGTTLCKLHITIETTVVPYLQMYSPVVYSKSVLVMLSSEQSSAHWTVDSV